MKQKCIFITGPESSGSTLIAKLLSEVLGNPTWSGRGFNCCDDGQCDAENGYVKPCKPVNPLVCHRSLPFKHYWPPIEEWKDAYDGKYVICTRDKNVSQISQLKRFDWKDEDILNNEEQRVLELLDDLINDKKSLTFIWSYETYVLLGQTYLYLLADFLEIPHDRFKEVIPPRNENRKYIIPPGDKSGFNSKSLLAHVKSAIKNRV